MDCTPTALAEAAKCWCLPDDARRAAWVYLLCAWLKKKTPVDRFSYEPQSAIMTWTDSGGTHSGNLAAFYATQTWASTTEISIITVGITSIIGLSFLPVLSKLACLDNSIHSIDLSGCSALTELLCGENPIQALDISACPALAILDTTTSTPNPYFSSLAHNNPLMNTLIVNGNNLNSLDVTEMQSLESLDCAGNPNLSNLNIVGCAAITFVDASQCKLPSSNVNSVLIQLDGSGVNGGTVSIFQTPPAPPTGAGIAAKNNLLAVGRGPWAVNTD